MNYYNNLNFKEQDLMKKLKILSIVLQNDKIVSKFIIKKLKCLK